MGTIWTTSVTNLWSIFPCLRVKNCKQLRDFISKSKGDSIVLLNEFIFSCSQLCSQLLRVHFCPAVNWRISTSNSRRDKCATVIDASAAATGWRDLGEIISGTPTAFILPFMFNFMLCRSRVCYNIIITKTNPSILLRPYELLQISHLHTVYINLLHEYFCCHTPNFYFCCTARMNSRTFS